MPNKDGIIKSIFPGILLKTHKTSHSQYTHPFYQSCLTVIDNGLLYLVEY